MHVSVVIATYNRAGMLPKLLKKWEEVKKASKYSFELIFSDDGSTDNTVEIIRNNRTLDIKILENKHSGASGARNSAIAKCIGDIILFTGDDIFPDISFIDKHYETYKKNGENSATLGQLIWPKDIEKTYLMHHITDIGCEQFSFSNLSAHSEVDFRHFYTSNISVSRKKVLELDSFFDMSFDKYGFEDIELGYRLFKKGVKIVYNPEIIGEHYHIYDKVKKFCNRQESAGETLITFEKLHPEIDNYVGIGLSDLKNGREEFLKNNSSLKLNIQNLLVKLLLTIFFKISELLEYMASKYKRNFFEKFCSKFLTRMFQYHFYVGVLRGLFKNDNTMLKLTPIYIYYFAKGGYSQFFFDKSENFSEDKSKKNYLIRKKKVELRLVVSKNESKVRFDPYNGFCKIKLLKLNKNKKEILKYKLNAKYQKGKYLNFSNTIDPIIIFEERFKSGDVIEIVYEISYFKLKQKMYYIFKKIKRIIER